MRITLQRRMCAVASRFWTQQQSAQRFPLPKLLNKLSFGLVSLPRLVEVEEVKPYAEIPTIKQYPLVGSMSTFNKHISVKMDQPLEFFRQLHTELDLAGIVKEKKDPMYRLGFPGHGDTLCLGDPREFMRVVETMRNHPRGGAENHLIMKRLAKKRGWTGLESLFSRGKAWKQVRMILQKGLISPKDKRAYINNVQEAARAGMPGALQTDAHSWCLNIAFDMVNSALLGRNPEIADKSIPTDPLMQDFFQNSYAWVSKVLYFIITPKETMLLRTPFVTKAANELETVADRTMEITRDIIASLMERKERGELTKWEECSYVSRLIDRAEEDDKLDLETVTGIAFFLLSAGVDTTASTLFWNMLLLGENPEAQERLRQEILEKVPETIPHNFCFKQLKYLRQVLRETHRLYPSLGYFWSMKDTGADLDIHGYKVPKGTTVRLDGYLVQMNPDFIPNPHVWNPDNWSESAVLNREGTAAEVVDHRLLANSFSAGARMCPGSRLAQLEIDCFLIELLRNYRWTIPAGTEYKVKRTLTIYADPCPAFKFEKL